MLRPRKVNKTNVFCTLSCPKDFSLHMNTGTGIGWVDDGVSTGYVIYKTTELGPRIRDVQAIFGCPMRRIGRSPKFTVFGWLGRYKPRKTKCGAAPYFCYIPSGRDTFGIEDRPAPSKRWMVDLLDPSKLTDDRIDTILAFNDGSSIFLVGTTPSAVELLGTNGSCNAQAKSSGD